MDWWNRCLHIAISDGLAYRNIADAGETDDVASHRLLDFGTSEPVESVKLRHSRPLDLAVKLRDDDLVAHFDAPIENSADCNTAQIVARIKICNEELKWRVRVASRSRHMIDDRVEKRAQRLSRFFYISGRRAGLRVRVQDREIDLFIVGFEVDE